MDTATWPPKPQSHFRADTITHGTALKLFAARGDRTAYTIQNAGSYPLCISDTEAKALAGTGQVIQGGMTPYGSYANTVSRGDVWVAVVGSAGNTVDCRGDEIYPE